MGTEHVIRGADTIYVDGRRAAFGGLKVVAFLEAIDGVTTPAFAEHWHDRHAALAADVIPDHISSYGYVQNHAIDDPPQAYAGVAESYWSDIAALGAWSSWYFGDDGAALRDDEDLFIDTTNPDHRRHQRAADPVLRDAAQPASDRQRSPTRRSAPDLIDSRHFSPST